MREGVLSAETYREAVEVLRSQNLIPTTVGERRRGISLGRLGKSVKIFAHVSFLDRLRFMQNLAVMLKAGLPLARALTSMSKETGNRYFSDTLQKIAKQVESGKPLSEAIQPYPRIFSKLMVSMVRVGEETGELDTSLAYLVEQLRRDYDLRSKARGAMTYPAVVLIALVIVGVLMFYLVLPKLTSTFKELNVELPFLTRLLLKVVDNASTVGPLLLVALLVFGAGFVLAVRTRRGKRALHTAFLHFPMFKKLVVMFNLARFGRILGALLKGGMPIVQALEVTSDTFGNVRYQEIMAEGAKKVRVGVPLSTYLAAYPDFFPPMVKEMIQVGEETGTVEQMLFETADFYESAVDQSLKNLSSIIEPLLMLFIGTIVGFFAVALISPIYSITQTF